MPLNDSCLLTTLSAYPTLSFGCLRGRKSRLAQVNCPTALPGGSTFRAATLPLCCGRVAAQLAFYKPHCHEAHS